VIIWSRRATVSHLITTVRLDAGGTRLDLARERVLIHWYRQALGPDDGTDLALLVLRAGRGRLGEADRRHHP
jgi:chorismate mutase